jgi:hypothetical protein
MSLDWIWPPLTLAAVSAVAWLIARELAGTSWARVEQRFLCPVTGLPVTATFTADLFDANAFADVARCSRFGEGPVTCDKECLALGKLAVARQDRARRAAHA